MRTGSDLCGTDKRKGIETDYSPGLPPQAFDAESTEMSNRSPDDRTEFMEDGANARFLRVGDKILPWEIIVDIPAGAAFTIGRFDVSVGKKQSDFEFEKRTRSVSRHHATVKRFADGTYCIVDNNSSAGTYLNGKKIPPNVLFPIRTKDRVSFGNAGADYVWMEPQAQEE